MGTCSTCVACERIYTGSVLRGTERERFICHAGEGGPFFTAPNQPCGCHEPKVEADSGEVSDA